MSCNVGGVERKIRIVAGIILVGIGVFAALPTAGTGVMLTLGTVALVSGAIGYCPLSALLGINTCQAKPGEKR